MKKFYISLIIILVTAILPLQALAVESKVTAKNDNGEILLNATDKIVTQNVDLLLPGITECKEAMSQKLTIKTEAVVNASLRLVLAEKTSEGQSPLNNYDITVKDEKGVTVYNSASAILAKRNDSYREIDLGVLQANEEKTFDVTYKIIDSTVDVSGVSLELAAKANEVAEPKFGLDSLDNLEEFVFDLSEELKNSDGNNPQTQQNEIIKVCGQDIPAGRFEVTGSGKLKVTSATGALKKDIVISATPEQGKSVDEEVVLIETGDVLKITPLDGQEKARLKFSKVTATSPTATEKAAAAALQAKATAAPKTNPKTGDGSVGVIVGVAALAVIAVAVLEFLKRKSKKTS